ncbi:MAG: hypothetical protein KGH89_00275 [Thaumarchaeota archaeon]|nr:hypothetical protein [Nitrososphaerota archaeon]
MTRMIEQASSTNRSFLSIRKILDEKHLSHKSSTIFTLAKYYIKLKIGELTKQVYRIGKENVLDIPLFDRNKNIYNFLDITIRNFIKKNSLLPNVIDPTKNQGYEHVGFGVFLARLLGDSLLITQGGASFYFSTSKKEDMVLSITFFSIPKISGTVKFEDSKIADFKIPSITQRTITLQISKDWLRDTTSKITISTNEFWSPYFFDKKFYHIPVGVGIRKIILYSKDQISD